MKNELKKLELLLKTIQEKINIEKDQSENKFKVKYFDGVIEGLTIARKAINLLRED
jgi:hypothetical protein